MTSHAPLHRADESAEMHQLEEDIARQRDALADTVNQLQDRLDVKARAQQKAHELRDRATTDSGRPKPAVAAAAVAGAGLVAGAVVLKKRHHD